MARATQKRSRTQARHSDGDGDDSDATDYSSDQPKNRGKGKAKAKPKKKQNKGKQREVDDGGSSSSEFDSDDSSGGDDDAAGGGGGRKGKQDLSEDEKKFYIQGMVRFVLFNESHRRVLRRQDMVKAVLTDGRGRHFNALLPKVQKILREVLGLDLVTLRQKESASGKPRPKAYIVRSLVPVPLLRHSHTHVYPSLSFATDSNNAPSEARTTTTGRKTLRNELAAWNADGDAQGDDDEDWEKAVMRDVKREEGALYGILGVVLALILVNGKVLGDDQLISYLKRLSLKPSSVLPLSLAAPHPDSITLAKYLELLVRQQYLESGSSGNTAGVGAGTQAGGGGGSKTQTQKKSGRPSATTQRGGGDKDKMDAGDPGIEWRWGPRSEAELGEVGVAKFVERIFFDPTSQAQAGKRGNGATDDDEDAEDAQGTQKKKAKKGEKFMNEVARAAGVKQLAGTEGIARGGGGDGDGEGEDDGEED